MEVPKIHLSVAEAELMQNAEIILTKNRVLEKIKELLGTVQEQQDAFIENGQLQTKECFAVAAKISRGENYLGLPWLILDYPRLSGQQDLFFIRSLFWWGNFFSSTLHLAGVHKKTVEDYIGSCYKQLGNYFIGIGADPWMHHFEQNNYKRIGSLTKREFIAACKESQHLKIATYWPVAQWAAASSTLFENWKFLLEIAGQLPRR